MSSLEDFFGGKNEDPFERKEKKCEYEDFLISLEDILKGKNEKSINENLFSEKYRSLKLLSNYLIKEPKIIYYNKSYKEEYINIIKNYDPILSNKFNKLKFSQFGLGLYLKDTASITADNIGEFALPIVEYIRQTQPDYVVASDRGARLLGLAVFGLYTKLYGKFPTSDGTLRFRRFSKSNTQEATEQHLQTLVDEMLWYKKRPTVLVLDDWVCSGGTKRLAQEVFDKLGKGRIKVKFGVLIGSGADISGHSGQTLGFGGTTDWHDDSNIIGVRYDGASKIRAHSVRSKQAINYRIRMSEGIGKLVKKIVEEGKEAVMAKC